MRIKKIFLIIGFTIVLAIIFVTPAKAVSSEIATLSDKDSYVQSMFNTTNSGDSIWVFFGYNLNFNEFDEAYIHFNFSAKPENWEKAEISIDATMFGQFNATVCLITDNWGEGTITWVNKPLHGEIITTFEVTGTAFYKFDISNYIQGDSISVCINASNSYEQSGYVMATSREGHGAGLHIGPQLIWTYETADPIIEGYNLYIFLGLIVVIGIISIQKKKLKIK
ncbi:MAG: DNRLRE domain-containing protein [Candidatus Lokiarchaeia archaeon]